MSEITPFKGRIISPRSPTRTLHRFTKSGGHTAEIRERIVTQFKALEFFVFVDHSLLESQMFHGQRAVEYPKELEARIAQFLDGGWIEAPLPDQSLV